MDELDVLMEALKRERFLTVLGKVVRYKKANPFSRRKVNTQQILHNADVIQILKDSDWEVEEFRQYYWAYQFQTRDELNKIIEKKNDK